MGLLDSLFSGGGSGLLGNLGAMNGNGAGQVGGGSIAGGWSNAGDGYFQNNQNAMLGLAAGLLQPTMNGFGGALSQGLQGYMAGRPADQQQQERMALGTAAGSDTTLTPQMRALLKSSPELAKAYLSQTLLNPNQQKMSDLQLKQMQFQVDTQGKAFPTFGEIGTNPDGSKKYGFIDVKNQTATPLAGSGGNGSMFSASSVDGQALNYLVQRGLMTPEQAATFAASKTSVNPQNGATSLITPMATGQNNNGVLDVTSGKPGGNLTEKQQQAKMLGAVIDKELPVVDKNFSELAKMGNQAAGAVPGIGNFMVSPGYQQASNSLKTIISSYLYVTSGATASPKEIDNQAAILTPKPGDDQGTIANKLARIHTMADAVKGVSGQASGSQQPAPTDQKSDPLGIR